MPFPGIFNFTVGILPMIGWTLKLFFQVDSPYMEDIKRLGSIVNRKQLEQNDIITTFKVYIQAFSAVILTVTHHQIP